jgi:hypothetical protein
MLNSWGSRPYQCRNYAKYGEFCGLHAPERIAARVAKRGPTKPDKRRAMWQRVADDKDKLKDALVKYGDHLRDCARVSTRERYSKSIKCTCGYTAVSGEK